MHWNGVCVWFLCAKVQSTQRLFTPAPARWLIPSCCAVRAGRVVLYLVLCSYLCHKTTICEKLSSMLVFCTRIPNLFWFCQWFLKKIFKTKVSNLCWYFYVIFWFKSFLWMNMCQLFGNFISIRDKETIICLVLSGLFIIKRNINITNAIWCVYKYANVT